MITEIIPTSRRLRKVVPFVLSSLAAFFATRCQSSSYTSAQFRLTATVQEQTFTIGATRTVRYQLRNVSHRSLHGCFTFRDGYDLWTSGGVKQHISSIDHPQCRQSFILNPNEYLDWVGEIIVPDVQPGSARFFPWVQVSNPRSCDEYGCDQTVIRAEAVSVNVER